MELVKKVFRWIFANWVRKLGISLVLLGVGNLIADHWLWDYLVPLIGNTLAPSISDDYIISKNLLTVAVIFAGVALIWLGTWLETRAHMPSFYVVADGSFDAVVEETRDRNIPTTRITIKIKVRSGESSCEIEKVVVVRSRHEKKWLVKESAVEMDNQHFTVFIGGEMSGIMTLEGLAAKEIKLRLECQPPVEMVQRTNGGLWESSIIGMQTRFKIDVQCRLARHPKALYHAKWALEHDGNTGRFVPYGNVAPVRNGAISAYWVRAKA